MCHHITSIMKEQYDDYLEDASSLDPLVLLQTRPALHMWHFSLSR